MSALGAIKDILAAAKPSYEDLPGGHERFLLFGIPFFDSRRAARRVERKLARIAVRKARRAARRAAR